MLTDVGPERSTRRGRPDRTAALRQLPGAVVLVGLLASALIMIPEQFSYRAACTGVTATCAVAAIMRAALPTRWVGVLAVRSRPIDVALLTALAIAVSLLAFRVPLPAA